MSNVTQKPIIDELLEEYFPEASYNSRLRKKAKDMALEFFKSARQEYAMQDEINTELFLGRELTQEEKDRNRKRWGL
jgi:hypothetical protein